tara:strand:- start:2700 stop:2924 length:225 start_codon:yes stop_codon:yes gene_type:complete
MSFFPSFPATNSDDFLSIAFTFSARFACRESEHNNKYNNISSSNNNSSPLVEQVIETSRLLRILDRFFSQNRGN